MKTCDLLLLELKDELKSRKKEFNSIMDWDDSSLWFDKELLREIYFLERAIDKIETFIL